jgi:hypothetical protein
MKDKQRQVGKTVIITNAFLSFDKNRAGRKPKGNNPMRARSAIGVLALMFLLGAGSAIHAEQSTAAIASTLAFRPASERIERQPTATATASSLTFRPASERIGLYRERVYEHHPTRGESAYALHTGPKAVGTP